MRYTTTAVEQLPVETTALPVDVTTEAVLDPYALFVEAERDGSNGFPTVIHQEATR